MAPVAELAHFDWVVVQAGNFGSVRELAQAGTESFAYLSVGEIEERHLPDPGIDRKWLNGSNPNWQTRIVNLTETGWHAYLIEQRMASLWAAGYRGFFLDTLDSCQIAVQDEAGRNAQTAALVSLIQAMHQRFPGVKLLLNRGFEVLPKVSELCVGVAAESLFAGWDQSKKEYRSVAEKDRAWLLARLQEVCDKYRLPVVIIDYVAPAQREQAREIAKQIRGLGFIPWVTNPSLDFLGVGSVEVVPRRILALYDGTKPQQGIAQTKVHRFLAPLLEYLGYAVDYRDVNGTLPDSVLTGRYRGIVSWFDVDQLDRPLAYQQWLQRQMDSGMRVAAFGRAGLDGTGDFIGKLGFRPGPDKIQGAVKIQYKDPRMVGFEAPARAKTRGLKSWQAEAKQNVSHLTFAGDEGQRIDAVVTAPWGGVALDPYVVQRGYGGGALRWIINPLEFLARALKLPDMPVPDVTTENGRRLLLVTIKSQGALEPAEMPDTPLAVDVIRDRILREFPVPSTLFLDGGSRTDEDDREASPGDFLKHLSGIGHLNVLDTSCGTSPSKVVSASEAAATQSTPKIGPVPTIDLQPIDVSNGGASSGGFSFTQLLPMGLPDAGGGYRVYAPLPDDFAYTNQWRGPFDGYRRVIGAFQSTDSPLRTKPIHLHYHLLSGSKIAAVEALQDVYRWAMAQDGFPVSAEGYARKVADFQSVTLSQDLDGAWKVRGLNTLRTLRIPPDMGSPDLNKSEGVKSMTDLLQGRYVSLSPGVAEIDLYFRSEAGVQPESARNGFRGFDGAQTSRSVLRAKKRNKTRVPGITQRTQ
ncbi:MAG: endo alpha-1,4 polygalactosaminidase [Gammaproteobacteria bacterium]